MTVPRDKISDLWLHARIYNQNIAGQLKTYHDKSTVKEHVYILYNIKLAISKHLSTSMCFAQPILFALSMPNVYKQPAK